MRKTITAKGVYNALVNDDKILTLKGRIQFHLGDVDIIVKQKDVVGNIIQEWLQGWLDKRGYAYRTNPNTQMPPDFFLGFLLAVFTDFNLIGFGAIGAICAYFHIKSMQTQIAIEDAAKTGGGGGAVEGDDIDDSDLM